MLTVEVLEIRQLNPLPHPQYVSRTANTVEQHPHVARVERRDSLCCLTALVTTEILQCVLNICPSRNDRAEYHQAEGEEGHARDGAAEP
jgi:hypothetical protein